VGADLSHKAFFVQMGNIEHLRERPRPRGFLGWSLPRQEENRVKRSRVAPWPEMRLGAPTADEIART